MQRLTINLFSTTLLVGFGSSLLTGPTMAASNDYCDGACSFLYGECQGYKANKPDEWKKVCETFKTDCDRFCNQEGYSLTKRSKSHMQK